MNRRKRRSPLLTTVIVCITASALTSLAVFASDFISRPSSSLASKVTDLFRAEKPPCPPDMEFIDDGYGGFCIDKYENSPGDMCAHQDVMGTIDSIENISNPHCVSVSEVRKQPWVFVGMQQAELLCARSGKRLPTNREWYRSAIGTPDDPSRCVIGREGQERANKTGSVNCDTAQGVSDMIGNVWEWVSDTINNGVLNGVPISDGYVTEMNDQGIPTKTASTSDASFGKDYLFAMNEGNRGVFRGGFWSLGERSGLYSMNVTMSPSFQGAAVGFRCVKAAEKSGK